MNVNYTAEELAFRDEVRAFLTNELPADIAAKVKLGKHMSKEDHQRWQQILVKRGWYAPGWPVELGGTPGARSRSTSSTRNAPPSARRAACPSASTWSPR